MKLIIIYGPPASGKLTIANELAEKTGYKLFHNHLTVDLLKNVLEFGTPVFFELNQKMKLDILKAAAKQGVNGLIYTFVYDRNTDNPFVEQIKSLAQKYDISLKFVQIYCETNVLLNRVIEASRKQHKKVQSQEGLINYLKSGDFTSSIDSVESIKIDSTNLSVDETIQQAYNAIK